MYACKYSPVFMRACTLMDVCMCARSRFPSCATDEVSRCFGDGAEEQPPGPWTECLQSKIGYLKWEEEINGEEMQCGCGGR
jgi:hypothetical protein